MIQATMEAKDPKEIGKQYGKPPRPCCAVHGVEMHVGSTVQEKRRRYWYCPVPYCGCAKRENY